MLYSGRYSVAYLIAITPDSGFRGSSVNLNNVYFSIKFGAVLGCNLIMCEKSRGREERVVKF